MKNLKSFLFIAFGMLIISCKSDSTNTEQDSPPKEESNINLAKFEPVEGKCILFVGQDQAAVGGVEGFEDGYFNHFDAPGGFTMYTNFSPGDTSFGYVLKGLDGVKTLDDWGDGPSNMSAQIADPDFAHSALAIGLWFVNHEKEVASGELDGMMKELGAWIKGLGKRPVFLRIGYEFGGEWNHYDREDYIASFKRIRDIYEEMGVENVAYVWQSHGWGMDQEELERWYPGDDYVDWCGYSMFSRGDEVQMIEFAQRHDKPVFIAEATPTISTETTKLDGKTKETILSNPEQAEEAWEKWFIPFFEVIQDPQNRVKAVSYINCHWKANPMWFDNPTFQDVDARLHINPDIAQRWTEETSKDIYLKASEGLWNELWGED